MQFTTIIIALAATASANPLARRDYPTPGGVYDACRDVLLYSVPQCCATDIGGIADLNCGNVPQLPKSPEHFQKTCASSGQQAKCCTLPVLGQALICNAPVGVIG